MENYEKIKQNPLDSLKKKYTNNGKHPKRKNQFMLYGLLTKFLIEKVLGIENDTMRLLSMSR